MEMLTWNEMQQQYKDQWIAMLEWEEDEHGDVTKGHVIYCHPNRKTFYAYLKEHLRHSQAIATRYTGNVQGPFFLPIR